MTNRAARVNRRANSILSTDAFCEPTWHLRPCDVT